MKFLIFFVSILVFSHFANGQTVVFKTYNDYLTGKGDKMSDDYSNYQIGGGAYVVKFKDSLGKVVKYKTAEIWGFVCKGYLFRMFSKTDCAMLVDTGKVNYYFNGFSALSALGLSSVYTHGDIAEFTVTLFRGLTTCYLSVGDMNAKLYRMPTEIDDKQDFKVFKKDFPDFEDLYDCFKFKGNITLIPMNIRDCVKEFDKNKKPQQPMYSKQIIFNINF